MSLSAEQLRSRLPKKFEILLPGHPKPEDYEVLRFSPFVMHQRCVEKMRNGRILLAGDAAHLCNPMYALTALAIRGNQQLTKVQGWSRTDRRALGYWEFG